jgi:hypothetical protein
MKTVILRTHKRTKSSSFPNTDPNNETDKTVNCPVTINYVISDYIVNI